MGCGASAPGAAQANGNAPGVKVVANGTPIVGPMTKEGMFRQRYPEWAAAYDAADRNKDGVLQKKEAIPALTEMLTKNGGTVDAEAKKLIDAAFAKIDTDKSGTLDLVEFCVFGLAATNGNNRNAMLLRKALTDPEKDISAMIEEYEQKSSKTRDARSEHPDWAGAFDECDLDKNDVLEKAELCKFFSKHAPGVEKKKIQKLYHIIDTDKNGAIDFLELCAMLEALRDGNFKGAGITKDDFEAIINDPEAFKRQWGEIDDYDPDFFGDAAEMFGDDAGGEAPVEEAAAAEEAPAEAAPAEEAPAEEAPAEEKPAEDA